jgi:hypothetical protein
MVALIFFLAIIVFGFKYVGKARSAAYGDRNRELFIWALGAALFANVVAFLGISYFDQTEVAWLTLLAIIPAAVVDLRKKKAAKPVSGESGLPQPIAEFALPAAAGLRLTDRLTPGPAASIFR